MNPAVRFFACPLRWLWLGVLIASAHAQADQKISKDGYDVHYSTFNSTFLDPQIARQYGIPRSKDTGVLNIAVIRPDPDSLLGTPMEADVDGTATNLLSQLKPLQFKKFKLEKGIYYISTFSISEQELLNFDVGVGVAGKALRLQFRHKFEEH